MNRERRSLSSDAKPKKELHKHKHLANQITTGERLYRITKSIEEEKQTTTDYELPAF